MAVRDARFKGLLDHVFDFFPQEAKQMSFLEPILQPKCLLLDEN